MGSHGLPKSHYKSTTEPQYEECGGGVTSSNVAIEDNAAYQSVYLAAAKPWAVQLKLYRDSTCVATQMWDQVSYVVCLRIGFVCVSVHWCACVCACEFILFYYSTIPVILTQQYNSVSEYSEYRYQFSVWGLVCNYCNLSMYNVICTGLIHSGDVHTGRVPYSAHFAIYTGPVTVSCDLPCEHVLS